MAFVVIWEAPGVTQDQYETTLRPLYKVPLPGRLVHLSGAIEGGWRLMDVWESQAHADAFGGVEGLQQALQSLGDHEQQTITTWHVHDIML